MKSLVIYDSAFGNTEIIAKEIGRVIDAEVVKVGDFEREMLEGVGLLVVGSPTQAFRPLKSVSDFLDGLTPDSLKGLRASSFDTRISEQDTKSFFLRMMMKAFGYAAKPISDKLKKKGAVLVQEPAGFVVTDTKGPLKEGEPARAAEWAAKLVR